jgi:Ni/Co efflux regulator RcnB
MATKTTMYSIRKLRWKRRKGFFETYSSVGECEIYKDGDEWNLTVRTDEVNYNDYRLRSLAKAKAMADHFHSAQLRLWLKKEVLVPNEY